MSAPHAGGQPTCDAVPAGLSLEHASALGRLAGGIAHDFNNLLTVILSNLDLLQLGNARNRELCVLQIREAAESGARLARQLQVFSRMRAEAAVAFNLNDLLHDVGGLLRRLIEERIQLTVSLGPDLRHIRGNRGQFEQLLLNLTLNARDAITGSGEISIATDNIVIATAEAGLPAGPYVTLTVSDDGAGMDAATQARVFEPYFSTKSSFGTGLGLTTVAEVVRQCHGHIRLTSAPHAGTTFTIYVPALEGGIVSERDPETPVSLLDTMPAMMPERTVLVVEDDALVRGVMQRTLMLHGHRVLVAPTPAEGLAMADAVTGDIDLLITDLIMPGMSGSTLARILKSRRPRMAVLFVSGYGEPTGEEILDGAGYLGKPFLNRALARRVMQFLAAIRDEPRSGTTSSS